MSTLGIRKKISARSDEGFKSYEIFKTADSYTQQNFDDFGKYAISVNMEAFILGQVRPDYYAPTNRFPHRPTNRFPHRSTNQFPHRPMNRFPIWQLFRPKIFAKFSRFISLSRKLPKFSTVQKILCNFSGHISGLMCTQLIIICSSAYTYV